MVRPRQRCVHYESDTFPRYVPQIRHCSAQSLKEEEEEEELKNSVGELTIVYVAELETGARAQEFPFWS